MKTTTQTTNEGRTTMTTFQEDKNGGWTYTCPATGTVWSVKDAIIVDAGENELDRVPAKHHSLLATRYANALQEGRVHLIGC